MYVRSQSNEVEVMGRNTTGLPGLHSKLYTLLRAACSLNLPPTPPQHRSASASFNTRTRRHQRAHCAAAKRISLSLFQCPASLMRKARAFIASHSELDGSTTKLLLDQRGAAASWLLLGGQTGCLVFVEHVEPSLHLFSGGAFVVNKRPSLQALSCGWKEWGYFHPS